MGEGTGKIVKHDPQNRVVHLRSEIESKRAALTMEIQELKNRREEAMITARKASKLAAFVIPSLFAASSLSRAFFDLARKDRAPEPMLIDASTTKTKSVQAAAGTSVVMTMATSAIRWAVLEFVRRKFGTLDFKQILASVTESKKVESSSDDRATIYSSSTS